MGKQAVEECDKGCEKVSNTLRKDYQKKLDDSKNDDFLRCRVSEWLIDSCERIVKEVRDSNQEKLEGAIRNKAVSNKINTFK
jgi:hypothetical protein